ncbi:hypothetical protein [Actinacidiphila rubida]|uniref:Uncharacterized protein n=1 Tax=Actinacidiphila rubida TaxID=310780 RepID=A0A1H8HS79_9ACTN|nr:hypothetical protein [Actinacidiphila rubida]SEN58974.1 hypothetical protein SAMN05216267_100726 [Actinacidiphila rubida]
MTGVNSEMLIAVWRRVLLDPRASWVLFAHGTCVVLTAPEGDLGEQAVAIMRTFGPVHVGSAAGDFGVVDLGTAGGWAVTGDHPDVLTYVAPEEVEEAEEAEDHRNIAVGLFGRAKRHRDGTELRVVHVEDRRDAAPPAQLGPA